MPHPTQAALKEKLRETAVVMNAEFSAGASHAKGSVYRKEELLGSMFSIDDDEDEEQQARAEYERHKPGRGGGADLDLARAVTHRTKEGYIVVSVDAIARQSTVRHCFQCCAITDNGFMIPAYLALTDKHAIELREQLGNAAEAVVMWRRELGKLLKIASKKKHPDLLSFYFELEPGELPTVAPQPVGEGEAGKDGEPPAFMQRYQVPQYAELKRAIGDLINAPELKPPQ